MAVTVRPGTSNATRDDWPFLRDAEGIQDDSDGSSFAIAPSGAAPTVAVDPGRCAVAGFTVNSDAVETLDLSAVGTQPAAGQKRVDLIVARYDWAVAQDSAGTIAVLAGSPVSSATADADAAPTPTRNPGTLYEVPLWRVSRPFGGVVTSQLDMRRWVGPTYYVANGAAPLPSQPVLGTLVVRDGLGVDVPELLRGLDGGQPAWLERQLRAGAPILAESTADVLAGSELRQLFDISLSGIEAGLVEGFVMVNIDAAAVRAGTIQTQVDLGALVTQHRWELILSSGNPVPLQVPFQVTNSGASNARLRVFIQSGSGVYRYRRPSLSIRRHSVRWVRPGS